MTTRTTDSDLFSENYVLRLPGSGGSQRKVSLLEILIPSLILLGALPFVINSMLGLRCLMAGAFFILFFSLRRSPALPILALIYLSILGGVRRNLIPIMGQFHIDPLLAVIPTVVGLIWFGKLLRLQIPLDNPIAKVRAVLLGLMLTIGLLNPSQGGVTAALGGAMFLVIPVLWSFIGRDLGDRQTLRTLYTVALIIAACGALYGIYQTLYGFTKGEQMWLASDPSYTSVNAGNAIRPMSFFTSAAEYPAFLAVCCVLAIAFISAGRWWALPFVLLLLAGMFYSGVRGPIVGTLLGIVVLWSVRGRSMKAWAPRLALAALIGAVGLIYGIKSAQNLTISPSQESLVQHQVEGLSNPTNPKTSTATTHATMALYGFTASLQYPLGIGLGPITLAGYQLGSNSTNMEVDWSNMFLALGPIGGIVYILLILTTLWCALKVWHHSRTFVALAILGVLVTTLNTWLNGDNYAIVMLLWFSIGALEREYVMLHAQTSTSPVSAARTGMAASSGT
ncbi:MAG TPA: hypothetical protein VKV29_01435 [Chthonomonas sp.]|uniref:hypothetical protein n=1 Tax=Chthonomonas sp. TaxID=2282153 RepID=UPI002B4AF6F8|nr:hypothetical protein [Chthonomonas sp.]HLH78925.1 hypothetical protein [Chthonomonas sp.]